MLSGRFRRLVAVVFVVLCAAATASCNNTSSDAATITYVDGTVQHISRSQLLDQVQALQQSKDFRGFLQSQNSSGILTPNPDAPSSQLTATWLEQLINQSVIDHQFDKQGLQVTSSNTANANTALTQTFSAAAMKSFPKSFQNSLLTAYSRRDAVLASCPSGRIVYHILLKTQAEAESVFQQIAQGGDFSKLAQQYSIDTGSKTAGGLLGCLYAGEFVPPFQSAAEIDQPDHVTVPVKSQFGYHLILVRQWNPADAATDQTLAQSAQQAANCTLVLAINSVHVWVNPQFGKWVQAPQSPCSQNQQVSQVAPPQAPNPRQTREPPPKSTTPTT